MEGWKLLVAGLHGFFIIIISFISRVNIVLNLRD